MQFPTSPEFWAGWVWSVFIDLLLAGDSVIAIARAALAHDHAPFPLCSFLAFPGWWFARGTARATEAGESSS